MAVLDLFRLDNKVALVTGVGRGLGQALALALAEAGADIAGLYHTRYEETQAQVEISANFDTLQSYHQALRRRDGDDFWHWQRDRFRIYRPDHTDHAWAVPGVNAICFHPGLDHVRYLDGYHLPFPPGYRRQDQPDAVQIF